MLPKMYSRPKPNDTEEDILKLQEEFLNLSTDQDVIPAAKVVKKPDEQRAEEQEVGTMELESTLESIPADVSVGKIVEKICLVNEETPPPFCHKDGFPKAYRRNFATTPSSHSNGSIFSQQMKHTKKSVKPVQLKPTQLIKITEIRASDKNPNLPEHSCIVTGEYRNDVHQENMEILQQMSEEEIALERRKLLSTLGPEVVQFLRTTHDNFIQTRTASVQDQNREAKNIVIDDIDAFSELLHHPEAEKWLNFDVLEPEKLIWMTNVTVPDLQSDEAYEARFDFQGYILPFVEPEINEQNRCLYHHGNEPGRPGYTLLELFQLCRSSVIQQKIIALNTIANILFFYQCGFYDGLVEIPIEQIFFVVRFCLDDNTPAVLNASMKAISNLFYYLHDEKYLDYLLGFGLGVMQPILAIDNLETYDDITVNDQQLAETNLVKCLIRTNILKRIEYIINTIRPVTETNIYCLKILIRLSRDSDFTIKCIIESNLLQSIVMYFMPVVQNMGIYQVPLLEAIKFCRLFSMRDKSIAIILVERCSIMESICLYLSNEQFSIGFGLKIQIESIHLWCVFLRYRLAMEYFDYLEPILLSTFHIHTRSTNISLSTSYLLNEHAAAYLNLLHESLQSDFDSSISYIGPYAELIYDHALVKWPKQFNSLKEYSCERLKIISALINCIGRVMQHNYSNTHDAEEMVYNLIKGEGFDLITNNIKIGSNLLSKCTTHKTSANLKSVETLIKSSRIQVIPIVKYKSCIPFLNVLSKFISNCTRNETRIAFFMHKNIKKYLEQLISTKYYNLIDNWFTTIESQFIMNIIKIGSAVHNEIGTSFLYEVAGKSLCIFHSGQKTDIEFILKDILFNSSYYPLNDVQLNNNALLMNNIDKLHDMFNIYTEILNLKSDDDNNLYTSIKFSIIPVDWIYSPLIWLYTNQQQNRKVIPEERQLYITINCLKWIYIYDTFFPFLTDLLDPTDRFCRLACTFLGSDTLFLNADIQNLLKVCLYPIIIRESCINFNKPIQGLNDFQGFFIQLLEQYQGTSYGDVLFSNFILLPLSQRHDVKYRKILWSEYTGVVQTFNLTAEQVMYPIDIFLYPAETDISLINCYCTAIIMGIIPKHSFLYRIANHHIRTSRKKK